MSSALRSGLLGHVALLAEGVDRNVPPACIRCSVHVALLAEGVDRNMARRLTSGSLAVALLAEGVDRNMGTLNFGGFMLSRPPCGGRG